jgi:hypothetical protein
MNELAGAGRARARPGIARLIMIAAICIGLAGCWEPPQIGMDQGSFKTVDALYTAVSMRSVAELDRNEKLLESLRAERKLPDSAAAALRSIVAEARSGKWEDAQRRLGDFMRGQHP